MKIRLRKVRPDDADDLARAWLNQADVYQGSAPELFGRPEAAGLGAWLVDGLAAQADPDHRLVLVADVDGTAVGFVIAAVVDAHPAPERQMQRGLADVGVRIEALTVTRRWWRQGVGTRLTTAVEDWARNRGARHVTAQVPTVGPAEGFLATRGYTATAVVVSRRL